jgi:hypothetical protein
MNFFIVMLNLARAISERGQIGLSYGMYELSHFLIMNVFIVMLNLARGLVHQ